MDDEPTIFQRPRRALAASGVLLGLFGVLAVVAAHQPRLGIDDTWWRWMLDRRTPTLTDFSKALDRFGDFGPQLVARVAVAVVLAVRGWGRRFGAWVFVALVSSPVAEMMKTMIDRPRPSGGLVHPVSAAFPSGHALAAAVTALGIVLALTAPGAARAAWSVAAAVYTAAMAWSRTELGVHWLTDVVAGVTLGAALTLAAFAIAALAGAGSSRPSHAVTTRAKRR